MKFLHKTIVNSRKVSKLLAEKYQVTSRTLSRWRSDYYKAEEGTEKAPDIKFDIK